MYGPSHLGHGPTQAKPPIFVYKQRDMGTIEGTFFENSRETVQFSILIYLLSKFVLELFVYGLYLYPTV